MSLREGSVRAGRAVRDRRANAAASLAAPRHRLLRLGFATLLVAALGAGLAGAARAEPHEAPPHGPCKVGLSPGACDGRSRVQESCTADAHLVNAYVSPDYNRRWLRVEMWSDACRSNWAHVVTLDNAPNTFKPMIRRKTPDPAQPSGEREDSESYFEMASGTEGWSPLLYGNGMETQACIDLPGSTPEPDICAGWVL